MRYYVYNDFKDEDLIKLKSGDTNIYMINNFIPKSSTLTYLEAHDIEYICCVKLNDPEFTNKVGLVRDLGVDALGIDCENYGGMWSKYPEGWGEATRELIGERFYPVVVYPENLGGTKYTGYDEFLNELDPDIVIMERCYQQTEWYNILFYFIQTLWQTKKFRPTVVIGCWYDDVVRQYGELRAKLQLKLAKWISGGKVMYYSETKSCPED